MPSEANRLKTELGRPLFWARKRLRSRGLVLMYHSVGTAEVDPWDLYVTRKRFAEQMEVLARSAVPLALPEFARLQREGRLPRRAVAVTLDDGYVNNLHEAAPILEQTGVDATVFVTTCQLESGREFWWDELAQLILGPDVLPDRIIVGPEAERPTHMIVGEAKEYSGADRAIDAQFRDTLGNARSARMGLYLRTWAVFQAMTHTERQRDLDRLFAELGVDCRARIAHRSMTTDEVVAIGDRVTIGAHTLTHPLLHRMSLAEADHEMRESKRRLESLLDREVLMFSYPFGVRDRTVVNAAIDIGFDSACAGYPETVCSSTDPFQLPRVQVGDWTGEEFERQIDRWFRFL